MAGEPTVTPGQGKITVSCTGKGGQKLEIDIFQGTTQVVNQGETLDGSGKGTYPFTLPAATYDVKVTIPSPGGQVFDFPNQVVT